MTIYTVTTLDDVVDANDGKTSLREAIALANGSAGADTIDFHATLSGGVIRLTDAAGTLIITDSLTINGDIGNDGTANITISGDKNADDTHIAGSTIITDVSATQTAGKLADNVQILSASADLTIDGLVLTGGNTPINGGAISSTGTVEVVVSVISGNYAIGLGGGIVGAAVELTNSTVSGNSAATGGGIYGSTVELTNSTVSGNSAIVNYGGGIFGTATLTNSTVSGNSATAGGGGIYSGSSVTLTNSIVSGNGAGFFSPEIFGTITEIGPNIVGGRSANIFAAIDPVTGGGLLADNGGPVPTIALNTAVTNPALDAGDDSLAPTYDARGALRFDARVAANNGANVSDLGAFEANPFLVTTLDDVVDANDGRTSLREAIALANSTGEVDTITFAIDLSGGVIRLTDAAGPLVVTNELFINGDIGNDGTPNITISGDVNGDDELIAGSAIITDVGASITAGTLADNVQILNASTPFTINGLVLTGGNASIGPGGAIAGTWVEVIDSLISGNHAMHLGGGIIADNAVILTNSTISGNSAGNAGGGILSYYVTSTNSTISGNSATFNGGGIMANDVTLTNSIVLGNSGGDIFFDPLSVSITANARNIVGANSSAFDTTGFANIINADPTLVFDQTVDIGGGVLAGVLADNGGPAATIALNGDVTNPALDAGGDTFAPSTDVRGFSRFDRAGVANNGLNVSDLGAFEFFNAAPTLTLENALTSIPEGTTASPIKVADIVVTDTDSGTNVLSLSGADSGLFEIVGSELFIKAGTVLDYFANPVLDVNVDVDSVLSAATLDASASLAVQVTDVTKVIVGTNKADFLIGDDGASDIQGLAGNDLILGGGANDLINGNQGNDQLLAEAGDDTIFGEAGNDLLVGGDGADQLDGGAGRDTLVIDDQDTLVFGGLGIDTLRVGPGFGGVTVDLVASSIERAFGGAGADTFDATGALVAIRMEGGAGGDTLIGGTKADRIFGGEGADTITGGAGADRLYGNALTPAPDLAQDTFVFATGWGRDTIYDFEDGVDQLDFGAFGVAADDIGDFLIRQSGANIIISIVGDTANTVTLKNMTIAQISDADFLNF